MPLLQLLPSFLYNGRRNLGGPSSKEVTLTLRELLLDLSTPTAVDQMYRPVLTQQSKVFICKSCFTEKLNRLREESAQIMAFINEGLKKIIPVIDSADATS